LYPPLRRSPGSARHKSRRAGAETIIFRVLPPSIIFRQIRFPFTTSSRVVSPRPFILSLVELFIVLLVVVLPKANYNNVFETPPYEILSDDLCNPLRGEFNPSMVVAVIFFGVVAKSPAVKQPNFRLGIQRIFLLLF